MKISLGKAGSCDAVAKFAFEGEMPKLGNVEAKIANGAARRKEFEGKAGGQLLLRNEKGGTLLLGLGKRGEFEIDSIRGAAARAALFARECGAKKLGLDVQPGLQKACGGGKNMRRGNVRGGAAFALQIRQVQNSRQGRQGGAARNGD